MDEPFARAAARAAVAQVVLDARDDLDDPSNRFKRRYVRAERSACDSLADVSVCYMATVGALSAQAAQHAGRAEANVLDVMHALEAVGADPPDALAAFARSAPQQDADRLLAVPPLPVPIANAAGGAGGGGPAGAGPIEPRPAHVPEWMPPFPPAHTYRRTAAHNERDGDTERALKRRAVQRAGAQDALLGLGVKAPGASRDPLPPPPGLCSGSVPAVGAASDSAHDAESGASGGAHAAGECSGVQATVSVPMAAQAGSRAPREGGAVVARAPGAPGESRRKAQERDKFDAVMSAQHLHDLDEVQVDKCAAQGEAADD